MTNIEMTSTFTPADGSAPRTIVGGIRRPASHGGSRSSATRKEIPKPCG